MNNKKSQKLFNSLTNVSDDFIDEAQEGTKKNDGHIKNTKLLPIAASSGAYYSTV